MTEPNRPTGLQEAIRRVEEEGIVFLDEIDKIVVSREARMYRGSADASSEGVQRDLLPIVEGTTVNTKFGNVKTDHILFICSGAFHSVGLGSWGSRPHPCCAIHRPGSLCVCTARPLIAVSSDAHAGGRHGPSLS